MYEKKNEFLVIFMIFQFLEINEKTNFNFNEKWEKKILNRKKKKILMGYCPFCGQGTGVRRRGRWGAGLGAGALGAGALGWAQGR